MNELLLSLALACGPAKIIDTTNSWGTDNDIEALRMATARCISYYRHEAPCLKTFTKMEEQVYRAVCGKRK